MPPVPTASRGSSVPLASSSHRILQADNEPDQAWKDNLYKTIEETLRPMMHDARRICGQRLAASRTEDARGLAEEEYLEAMDNIRNILEETYQAELIREREERARWATRHPRIEARSGTLGQAHEGGRILTKKEILAVYDKHERLWAMMGSKPQLRWKDFPWPMFKVPASPEQITPRTVSAYIQSPHYPKTAKIKTYKGRLRDYIRRWHPSRFEAETLRRVVDDHKESVSEAFGLIIRALNDLNSQAKDAIPPKPEEFQFGDGARREADGAHISEEELCIIRQRIERIRRREEEITRKVIEVKQRELEEQKARGNEIRRRKGKMVERAPSFTHDENRFVEEARRREEQDWETLQKMEEDWETLQQMEGEWKQEEARKTEEAKREEEERIRCEQEEADWFATEELREQWLTEAREDEERRFMEAQVSSSSTVEMSRPWTVKN